jgi:hypothetical protein
MICRPRQGYVTKYGTKLGDSDFLTNSTNQFATVNAGKKISSRKHQHGIIGANLDGDPWRFLAASASGPMKSSLQLVRVGWARCTTPGIPQPLTRFADGEASHRWPAFLADGRAALFTALNVASSPQVVVQSVGTGERRNLSQAATQPRHAPSGHLVYAQVEA